MKASQETLGCFLFTWRALAGPGGRLNQLRRNSRTMTTGYKLSMCSRSTGTCIAMPFPIAGSGFQFTAALSNPTAGATGCLQAILGERLSSSRLLLIAAGQKHWPRNNPSRQNLLDLQKIWHYRKSFILNFPCANRNSGQNLDAIS